MKYRNRRMSIIEAKNLWIHEKTTANRYKLMHCHRHRNESHLSSKQQQQKHGQIVPIKAQYDPVFGEPTINSLTNGGV